MAFFKFCFLALLVLLGREQYTTGYEYPSHPVFPFASLNGSKIVSGSSLVSGNWAGSGATCTDAFGDFPCSCLALSLTQHASIQSTSVSLGYITEAQYAKFSTGDGSITGSTTVTYGGNEIYTQSYFAGPSPPDDCCESCEIDSSGVRILFWPVDIDNTTAHNTSQGGATEPYTTVSDGFTFTSPSVYVAYDNLQASTECFRFGYGLSTAGKIYNTTLAYKSEDLSTSQCLYGTYKQINYTELQYPPPNSLLANCYHPGGDVVKSEFNNPSLPSSSPIFSYPPDVSRLIPSWKACTMSQLGAFDPPRTLSKATAMDPVTSSPLPAAPAATVIPAHAPATPTPDPKGPQATTSTAALPVDPANPGSSSDPGKSGLGSEQGLQNSGSPKSGGPEAGQTPPSSVHPATNESPSNTFSSNSDPSKNDPGGLSTNILPANNPSQNDPSMNSPPGIGQSSNNDPASNNHLSNGDPSKNDPSSVVASPNSPSPQVNAQSQNVQNQSPSSINPDNANSVQTRGLGALIASAFGYVPGPTAPSVINNPNVPNPEPKFIETVVNGSPSPVVAGGSPVPKVSNCAVLVAGQTVAQGSQATVSGAGVSVGSNSVAIDGTNHAFSPLVAETPTPLMVGANTAQRNPSGDLVVASQTLAPGTQATVAGVVISVGSSKAILDGTTHNLAPIAPTPLSLVINGATTPLQPGIAGASKALVVKIEGQAMTLSQASPDINIGGQSLTPGASHQGPSFVIAGQTLTPGGAAITVSGIPISLPAGQTYTLNPSVIIANDASVFQAGGPAQGFTPVTVGNEVFTPNPTAFSIAGTTISAGGPGVTIAGTLITLQPSGAGLVLGSSTITLPSQSVTPNAVTIGSQVFTPNPTGFSIAGIGISAGGPGVTVNGTVISLEASGVGLVVGSSTIGLEVTALNVGIANWNSSSGAANATSSSVAGKTNSSSGSGSTNTTSNTGSVTSTSSGRSTTANSQPTQTASSGEHTHSSRRIAGSLILAIASNLALSILVSV